MKFRKLLQAATDLGVFAILFLLVIGLPFLLKPHAPPDKKVPVKISSIVRLVRDEATFCSGVVIRHDLVLTAYHCVAEVTPFGSTSLRDEPVEIRAEDNKPIQVWGHPVAARPQLDQAILIGNFGLFEPRRVEMNIRQLLSYQKRGLPLMACGYPMGGELFCQTVLFDSTKDFMWAVKGLLLPGMSGGPVSVDDAVVATNDAVSGEYSIVAPVWNLNTALPEEEKR